MTRRAIGEILVGGRRRGTAFAVSRDLALTCWHCVAHLADRTRLEEDRIDIRLAPGVVVSAVHLDHDLKLDLALLGFLPHTPLPDQWTPVALGRDIDVARGIPVDVVGWPVDNPGTSITQVMPGKVEQTSAGIKQDAEVLQIYSDQVAAGMRPRGFSGSPVLVRTPGGDVALGVICWMQEDDDHPGRARGGVVYATRVSDISARWPALRPVPNTAKDLAGDRTAPLFRPIEDFLGAQLSGPGGQLPFAGRDADLRALTDWLDDADGPAYMLVDGPIGIGKSTLVLRWSLTIARRTDLRLVVVPVSVRFDTAREHDFMVALLHRLSRVHGETYNDLVSVSGAREEIRALLMRPAPAGSTLVVVLDALDEASGWSSWRGLLPREPGKGVRILLTARHMLESPTGATWLERLRLDAAAVLTLSALPPAIMAELIEQTRPHDDTTEVASAADLLWTLTSGDPVTVGLYLDEIRQLPPGQLGAWTDERHGVPPGLDGYFRMWWQEQRQLWSIENESSGRIDDAERVLRVLAVAEGPVARSDLKTLVGRLAERLDTVRLERAVELLGRLVLPARATGSIVVAHPAIADMLRTQLREDGSLDEVHQVFVDWGVEVIGALRSGDLRPSDVPDYLSRHFAAHIATGDRFHQATMDLVTPLWRKAKDATSDDPAGFSTDVRLIMSHARRLDDQRTTRGEAPVLLPERVLCADEFAGEYAIQKTRMNSTLAAEFVRHGLWRPARALGYVAANTYPGSPDCAYGVAAVAPVIPADQLPTLDQLIDSALKTPYPEQKATVVAAWAARLLDLGYVAEALDAAFRLPEGHEQRGFVAVWVLAELIPRLPDEQASAALHRAMVVILRSGRSENLVFAVRKLTREVRWELADRLWGMVSGGGLLDDVRAHVDRAESYEQGLTGLLITALDSPQHDLDLPPFHRGYGWDGDWRTQVEGPPFVATASWLNDDIFRRWFHDALASTAEHHPLYSPGINYEGLMSVATVDVALAAVARVRQLPEDPVRLCCLAQLLPLLDGERRRSVEDEIFRSPNAFIKLSDNSFDVEAMPALAAAGVVDRVIDMVVQADEVSDYFLARLTKHMILTQAEDLFAALPARNVGDASRRALLVKRASAGPRQAAPVLDAAYDTGQKAVSRYFISILREEHDDPLHWDPEAESPLRAWWSDLRHSSTPDESPRSFRLWSTGLDGEELHEALRDPDVGPLELAVELATGAITVDHIPPLVERARTEPDPWAGLVLLAAATHLPDRDARRQIMDATLSLLNDIRAEVEPRRDTTEQRPWLDYAFNGWVPYLARLIAPDLRPEIANLLFAGDYLDGVYNAGLGDIDGRGDVDKWACDTATVTPLLDLSQLGKFGAMTSAPRPGASSPINRSTVKAIAHTGIAIGHAYRGDLDQVRRTIRRIGGPDPYELRSEALAEILYVIPPTQIPEWVSIVHVAVPSGEGYRDGLWRRAAPRLAELADEQAIALLNDWIDEFPKSTRGAVLGDLRLYREVIIRVAGDSEYSRVLDLLNHAAGAAAE